MENVDFLAVFLGSYLNVIVDDRVRNSLKVHSHQGGIS